MKIPMIMSDGFSKPVDLFILMKNYEEKQR